jgi:hypothetical protein
MADNKNERIVINEGVLKKNLNPPPTSDRPPPPKAQSAQSQHATRPPRLEPPKQDGGR